MAAFSKKPGNLFLALPVLTCLFCLPLPSNAQYSELFSTPNKGYKISCVNDLAGVNWSLTPWDATGTCQVADLRDPTDYFNTTAAGVLESIDLDQEVCWESPLINISAGGTVSLSVGLTWAGFDVDAAAGNCLGDYITVMYSVNGGAYTMVPNQFGANACATVAYPLGSTPPVNGTGTVTQGGISGTTLKIRVCVFTNANAEIVTIDNVSVPQAGVTLNCAQPVLSTTLKNIVCNGSNSGSIDLSVSGGTPGYTYFWTGGATTQDRTGLATGSYTVTVTDAASCSQTTSVTIINSPLAQSAVTFPAACGSADGAIDLSVSGGNAGYTYTWTGGATTQDISGLAAGAYTVTVTDTSMPACTSTAPYSVAAAANGPYAESFSVPNRGYLINQVNNFFGMRWTMSPWTLDEPVTGIGRDNGDYFQTTAAGKLETLDTDQEICWISPELNISASGTVQFSVDLAWLGFDDEDYILVQYSINGGAFTTLPNAFGGGVGTVQYSFPNVDQNGTVTVTKTGLSGSTLQIKVCILTNSQADVATLDNVSIPQTVSLCPPPLPLELLSFSGKVNGRDNLLAWETAAEKNVQVHLVERSAEGTHWTEVGLRAGQLNAPTTTKYTLEDRQPLALAYYRLRSVDVDGQQAISRVIVIDREAEKFGIRSVYPNPATEQITVQFFALAEESVRLEVLNVAGQLVAQQSAPAQPGLNTVVLPISHLPTGVYSLLLSNDRMVAAPSRVVKE